MVTHRGTSQKDATVHVAAEPADGPGSENHHFVVLFHGGDGTVRVAAPKTAPGCCDLATTMTSQHAKRPNDTKFSGERSESAATRC